MRGYQLTSLVGLDEQLIDRQADECHRQYNCPIKYNLFHPAPCLVVSAAIAAEQSGHAGGPLLKKNERDDCHGKDDLRYCDDHSAR